MLNKAIDDWLANVSERTFEVPFAQLLMLEGYSVVHLANPHGPMEQGKDILAIDPSGVPCAFQLKQGNLSLKNWRNPDEPLKGQVEDLLDLQIQHPSVRRGQPHKAFLVTTGSLDETLRQHIDVFNQTRRDGHKPELTVIVRGELLMRFEKAFGGFLPVQLKSLRDFLQLITADPRGTPDKARIASLFDGLLAKLDAKSSAASVQTLCAEIVIVGANLAHPYQGVENWVGEIEVWTLVATQLLYIASTNAKGRNQAQRSLKLVELAIWQAMKSLIKEHEIRNDYVEGSPLEDGFVYRARLTHLAGYMGAAALWESYFSSCISARKELDRFWAFNREKLWLWGEGAVPSFLLPLEVQWQDFERKVFQLLVAICRANQPIANDDGSVDAEKGLSSPYVQLNEVLKESVGLRTDFIPHSYRGQSFAAEPLVMLLVRRIMRVSLSLVWFDVAGVSFEKYIPEESADLWRWHNRERGRTDSSSMPWPTSWTDLLEASRRLDSTLIPPLAETYPHILILHLLACPHRFNTSVALFVDQVIWAGGSFLGEQGGH